MQFEKRETELRSKKSHERAKQNKEEDKGQAEEHQCMSKYDLKDDELAFAKHRLALVSTGAYLRLALTKNPDTGAHTKGVIFGTSSPNQPRDIL
jgi:hypothetical protein